MMEKLRRDSYAVGVVLGIVVTAVLFGILYGIYALVLHFNPQMLVNSPNLTKILIPKLILLAMIPNIFILRHYLLKLKYDKSGRGILIATFVWAIVFLAAQFLL
ncbi:MAG: hypothetical protein IKN78_10510 [Bacteroidales bacterium]|nr:hypothetical protein [Bacteroidales bacterium]